MQEFRKTKIYKICGYVGCGSLFFVFIPLIFTIFQGGWSGIGAIILLLCVIACYPVSSIILLIAYFVTKGKSINSKYSYIADIGNVINIIISCIGLGILNLWINYNLEHLNN